MANDKKLTNIKEVYSLKTFIKDPKQSITNTLFGYNTTLIKPPLITNSENVGYIFFTRPQLNLSVSNIINNRKMYQLLSSKHLSPSAYVRKILDPRVRYDFKDELSLDYKVYNIFGNKIPYPFIPVLSNAINSVSGSPDIVLPTFTSQEGRKREQYSQGDGITDVNYTYDLDISFRNIAGGIIVLLFQIWTEYISSVFQGYMYPYLDFIAENEIDYMCRIYRIILNQAGTHVSKIMATGVSFPLNFPSGQFFDYTDNSSYLNNSRDITIRFRCIGSIFNDPILIKEFNDTVDIFSENSDKFHSFRTDSNSSSDNDTRDYVAIKNYNHIGFFNYRCFPYINEETNEFLWLTPKTEFRNIKNIDRNNFKDS